MYIYRHNPCIGSTYAIVGLDVINGIAGILEWCKDITDAANLINVMDTANQFMHLDALRVELPSVQEALSYIAALHHTTPSQVAADKKFIRMDAFMTPYGLASTVLFETFGCYRFDTTNEKDSVVIKLYPEAGFAPTSSHTIKLGDL